MTNDKIELKRCPFCNGTAKEEFVARGILGSNQKTYTFWIECIQCGATGKKSDKKRWAIKAWNKRSKSNE